MKYRIAFLIGMMIWASNWDARADSIWDRRDPRSSHIFQDNRARAVGDLLTVVISESTTTNDREQRNLDKSTTNNATMNFKGASSGGANPPRDGALDATYANNQRRRFAGSAQLTSGRTFVDRLAVTVVDTMPNGNLVIEGYRTRLVSGEERTLRITGIVRPADIGAGNSIQSQSIANFRISYIGRGHETEFVNQSLLGRFLNNIWP